jgi:hypothetical protein
VTEKRYSRNRAQTTQHVVWGQVCFFHLICLFTNLSITLREQPEGANISAEPDVKLPGTIEDLRVLAKQCAKFFLDHNAEPDAVDLLEELEIIDEVTRLVDENTYGCVCQYMIRYVFYTFIFSSNLLFIRCVNLLPPPDDVLFLRTAHAIYIQYHICLHLMMSFSCAPLTRSTSSITSRKYSQVGMARTGTKRRDTSFGLRYVL